MNKFQAKVILNWIEQNLIDTDGLRRPGKGLTAGYWRYRIGATEYVMTRSLQKTLCEELENEIPIKELHFRYSRKRSH